MMGIAFLKSRFIKSSTHIKKYIEYLDRQSPLFSQDGELKLSDALEDALNPLNSIIWDQIFSLTAEDAQRLCVDREYLKNLLTIQKHRVAAAYNISPANLRIVASFHDADHHPHIHMLIYSTDRREGYIKVHRNASKEEILNHASEKLKSILTNAIFRDERIIIEKEKSTRRDTLHQSLKKAIEIKPEIQEHLVALAKDLANFPGRKTAYGYLPPQLKQSVDDLLERIITQDTTCAMAYENFASSQRALLKHYAKRTDVLEEKMSEWRHEFLHPPKNGDASRHNMILKAAFALCPSVEIEPETKKHFYPVQPCAPAENVAFHTVSKYLFETRANPQKCWDALKALSNGSNQQAKAWSLYYMAKMKIYGIGTSPSYETAQKLFKQSEEAGNSYAAQAAQAAQREHFSYHAKSTLAITRTLIRHLAMSMAHDTNQNHTMRLGQTRQQKLRRASRRARERHEPLYP